MKSELIKGSDKNRVLGGVETHRTPHLTNLKEHTQLNKWE